MSPEFYLRPFACQAVAHPLLSHFFVPQQRQRSGLRRRSRASSTRRSSTSSTTSTRSGTSEDDWQAAAEDLLRLLAFRYPHLVLHAQQLRRKRAQSDPAIMNVLKLQRYPTPYSPLPRRRPATAAAVLKAPVRIHTDLHVRFPGSILNSSRMRSSP